MASVSPTGQIVVSGRTTTNLQSAIGLTSIPTGVIGVNGTVTTVLTSAPPIGPPQPPTISTGVVKIAKEVPPTRVSVSIETPKGKFYRWGQDEPDGQNVPQGLRFSSVAPGGFESLDVTLPRNPRLGYQDVEPLSTIRVHGAGGDIAWEGRIEGVASTSGDQHALSISAVGWQAHLQDREDCSAIFIDRDLSQWGDIPLLRKEALYQGGWSLTGNSGVNPGVPATLTLGIDSLDQDTVATTSRPWGIATTYYQAGPGNSINRIRSDYFNKALGGGWFWQLYASPIDGNSIQGGALFRFITDAINTTDYTAHHSMELPAPNSPAAVLQLYFDSSGAAIVDSTAHEADLQNLRVFGTNIPIVNVPSGNGQTEGVHASDAIQYIIDNFAPKLNASAATIQPSTFVIPQLRFDQVTAGDMINGCIAFGTPLPDWYVWSNKTLYIHGRNTNNRKWEARIGPSQLSETGPALNQMWNQVVVSYTDVDGTNKTTPTLIDSDPESPLNQAGLTRTHNLSMGITSTADIATQIGQAFLSEAKLISRAGQATHQGTIKDANTGALYPSWAIKAGDEIFYVDAADTTSRRVVHIDYDDSSRTATVQLDSPPDSMAGLLARLGVSISSVGVG